MRTAEDWIQRLDLRPHPEGGHYRETYRAPNCFQPEGFPGPRAFSTGIYFLLRRGECSHFHRMRSDELWHFYDGGRLSLHLILPGGEAQEIPLGLDGEQGALPQAVIPAGCWFGAEVHPASPYALLGCTVSPGFDFEDFELARRGPLLNDHPRHRALIERLTLPEA